MPFQKGILKLTHFIRTLSIHRLLSKEKTFPLHNFVLYSGSHILNSPTIYSKSRYSTFEKPNPKDAITVNFILQSGDTKTVTGKTNDNLLDIAHGYGIDLEGACEGSLACSTCHVIVNDEYYDKLGCLYSFIFTDEPSDEENDMLDLAFGLTDTSRLGCQIKLTKELDGITVRIPSMTRNVQQVKLK